MGGKMGAVRRLGDTRTALLHLDRLRDIARILNKSKEGFFKLSAKKDEMLGRIQEALDLEDEFSVAVIEELEQLLHEGHKRIQVYRIDFAMPATAQFVEDTFDRFPVEKSNHLIVEYPNELTLIKVSSGNDNFGDWMRFDYGTTASTEDGYISILVTVDVYYELNYMILRTSPLSEVYEYMEVFDKANANKISDLKLFSRAAEMTLVTLSAQTRAGFHIYDEFRGRIFELIKRYAFTPKPIQYILDSTTDQQKQIAEDLGKLTTLRLPDERIRKIESDIKLQLEKHISINWDKKEDFIAGRNAYPFKLKIKDQELSRVTEQANKDTPLQMKEAFFNNKRSLFELRKSVIHSNSFKLFSYWLH